MIVAWNWLALLIVPNWFNWKLLNGCFIETRPIALCGCMLHYCLLFPGAKNTRRQKIADGIGTGICPVRILCSHLFLPQEICVMYLTAYQLPTFMCPTGRMEMHVPRAPFNLSCMLLRHKDLKGQRSQFVILLPASVLRRRTQISTLLLCIQMIKQSNF